jgi:AraC-like DNA-binding protein
LRLAERFLPLTYSYVPITHRRDGGHDVLLFEPPAALADELRGFVVERAMGASVRVLRDVTGVGAPLAALRLRGPAAPAPVAAALSRQLGCQPQWRAADNRICLAHRLLQRPLPQANAVTAAMCERMCEELVERRRTRLDTVTLVREYLTAVPDPHAPRLAEVAALLCTSERTLKRWLSAAGTSFRDLLEDSRRAKADRLLRDSRCSLTEAAARLGFSDLSSFSQAYKRWTGTAPSKSLARNSDSGTDPDL